MGGLGEREGKGYKLTFLARFEAKTSHSLKRVPEQFLLEYRERVLKKADTRLACHAALPKREEKRGRKEEPKLIVMQSTTPNMLCP